MMTGAPEEEEMMREVEGEAWMTGHVVVVMTPNPGSPSGDLVSLYQNLYQNFNFDINTKFSSLIIYLKNGLFSRMLSNSLDVMSMRMMRKSFCYRWLA